MDFLQQDNGFGIVESGTGGNDDEMSPNLRDSVRQPTMDDIYALLNGLFARLERLETAIYGQMDAVNPALPATISPVQMESGESVTRNMQAYAIIDQKCSRLFRGCPNPTHLEVNQLTRSIIEVCPALEYRRTSSEVRRWFRRHRDSRSHKVFVACDEILLPYMSTHSLTADGILEEVGRRDTLYQSIFEHSKLDFDTEEVSFQFILSKVSSYLNRHFH